MADAMTSALQVEVRDDGRGTSPKAFRNMVPWLVPRKNTTKAKSLNYRRK
jgi:hypothetical protein